MESIGSITAVVVLGGTPPTRAIKQYIPAHQLAIAKFTGAVITGSAGLLAEAVHSLADTGNQALLLVGGKKAQRQATDQFQFGYGRER